MLTTHSPQVFDNFRGLVFRYERVRLVGVPGGQQTRRRTGGLTPLPVFEALEVILYVRLLTLVLRTRFYRASPTP